ncbi:PapB/FocB family fimbrial expression transcriptional regulator [Arsukibacterium sp.]|uniref:PapB/FocB family fimbrial expression transcriptional regulator n=1 Tax=Arsukibacterium sp. TaxID=1977258 RepID=UPI00299E202F|nr:PapB/FocB family fimbrial expression transcriptional regulator [Arsukibacterium sp.]MDX1538863.1 PapB/FocB family fimbrial expression transcriptional regulator [Arsukibacterium sp.]
MKYISQGSQCQQRFELLLSRTDIRSDNIKSALKDHLVTGLSDSVASAINGVSQSNFNRAFNAMNDVAETVEKIKEIDWARVKSVN